MQCRRPWFDSWVRKICWRRDKLPIPVLLAFPCGSAGKESARSVGDLGSIPGLGRFPWRRERLPPPVFWPGGFHGLCSWWNSPEQNSGVGSLSLLEGNFPTQGSNPGLSHCRQILYQLSHKGRPRIVEWVAYPLSSGFSQPRSWTSISCIAGGIFTNWAIREALIFNYGCVTQV